MDDAAEQAARRVAAAWSEPGPNPMRHAATKRHLKRDWPALARAVEALADEIRRAGE